MSSIAPPDSSAGLQVLGLGRRFGEVTALDDVGFDVPPGRLVGFVGGNGAGKTTTMRIVMGVLAADSGQVHWAGAPATAAERARFGYMPEERGLYPKQKVLDQLVYLGRLHGMSASEARTTATELLESFGLGERLGAKLETLSLGNQQRVQIIAAVLHDPIALILDEPFSGLDPEAVDAMAAVLRSRTAAGVPVLFSSHQLDLVERLCDEVVVLARGRVVAHGTPDALRDTGTRRWRIVLGGDAGWVRGRGDLHVADVDGTTAIVEPLSDRATQDLLAEAVGRGPVHEFARIVPALSEIYREVTA
ncbi:MAG: ATP-binding cassette domain-containing protein [Dermatophilaceae bacterium]